MRWGLATWCSVSTVLIALGAEPAEAYILNGRWSRTATNISTGPQGTPISVTWSLAPDGTTIPSSVSSNLIAFLDANFGAGPGGSSFTERPWFAIFEQSFARLSELSGVTFLYEPNDDARDFSNSFAARGILGTRGDMRIGGKSFGAGSNTLGANFFPDYGEMMINTDQVGFLTNSNNDYRAFRNLIMHEALHGVGVDHVSSSSAFLMRPFLSTAFDGPQLDDLRALHRLYGDVYEKSGGNDTRLTATPLGPLSPTQPIALGTLGNSTQILAGQVDFLSIDGNSDVDYFSFTVDARWDVTLGLTPQGTTYQVGPEGGTQSAFNSRALSDLALGLFDSSGTSLQFANENPAGLGETILHQLLPGTYFARVTGAQDDVQLYQLAISASLPAPADLLWVGNHGTDWDVALTANFSAGAAEAAFYDLDHVTFDDSSEVRTVHLPGDVAAGEIRVTTAGTYGFTGPGGIVAGNVTVDGAGVVELANAGNSYAGDTRVVAGTLTITGDANAMVSSITVGDGATLVMDATDAADMQSTFHVEAGGVLQIGQLESNGPSQQAFPEAPTALENLGAIRILRDQALTSISGSGNVVVERETLRLSGDGTLAGTFQVDAGATLELAGTHQFDPSARLTGAGQVAGDLLMPGTIAPGSAIGTLSLSNDLTLVETSVLEVQLGGAVAGVDFDTLNVGGIATLAGTLDIALVDDFAPTVSDTFELVTATDGILGGFDTVLLPELPGDLMWDIYYGTNSVLLQVAAAVAALPGDFDANGRVENADLTLLLNNWGKFVPPAPAGWIGTAPTAPAVNNDELTALLNHWGNTTGSGALSSAAVPEPTTAVVLISGVLAMVYRRRSRCVIPPSIRSRSGCPQ